MSSQSQSRYWNTITMLFLGFCFLTAAAQAQLPEIYLSISDTTVAAGDTTVWVTVNLANYRDTLSAFTLRVVLDNPELANFRTDAVDTTYRYTTEYCVAWNGGVCTEWRDTLIIDTLVNSGALDTTGTLISGWEYVTARSFSENRTDVKVTAIADALGIPYTPGINPRTNPGVLFRLRLRASSEVADSSDNIAGLLITDNLSETAFSDPHGDFFGVITNRNFCDTTYIGEEMVIDTFFRYWICTQWNGPDCENWISTTNDDSAVYAHHVTIDTIPHTERNPATTFYDDGELTVNFIDCTCGDLNGDGLFNVGDPVYLINHIFKGGPAPIDPDCADVNNDNDLNVGDAVYAINAVFKGGPMPNCGF